MLRVMDEVHGIVSGHDDLESMLDALLERTLDILNCDRAWLLYPCDPEAPTWSVPMEKTRAAWPGAYARNLEIPMDDGVRPVFEAALAHDTPVTFDRDSALQVPPEITEMFGVRAQMILSVHPKTDRPWMIGIHHCEHDHVYTDEERNLFSGIGRRLGDSLSTLIALRDLRASEANLEQAVRERTEELRLANEELQAFSYSVSHDLMAPIRAVRGFSELLEEHLGEDLDETARLYLHHLSSGGDRMHELVEGLMRLSRATRATLRRTTVDLTKLARICHADCLRDSPRDVEVHIQEGLTAEGDGPLLHIALENLFENAWKYSSREERAVVEVGRNDGGIFYVRDNGVGFDMEDADRLFESFSRLQTGAEFRGTGIGLSTVRRIISRHGGRVWAQGEPGAGATFYFELP